MMKPDRPRRTRTVKLSGNLRAAIGYTKYQRKAVMEAESLEIELRLERDRIARGIMISGPRSPNIQRLTQ